MWLGVDMRGQAHASGAEDARVHHLQFGGDARSEAHVRNDVALGIESRRDFYQFQSIGPDPKYGALRHEQSELIFGAPDIRAVADLLQFGHELPVPPFSANHRRAVLPADVEVTRGQRAAEDNASGVLADVDKAADPDDLVAETTDVDVSLGIDLREGQKREVQAAAVVEVELRGLLDHRREVLAATGIAAADRRAADDALLVGEIHGLEQAFLGRNRGQSCRYAGAQIADCARKQLHRRSAHDYLARPERQRLNVLDRYAQLARVAGIVVSRVRL